MNRAAFPRQRLPCVALFLGAAAGVILGRFAPVPGGTFALAGGAMLLAALTCRGRHALLLGVALVFAAAQAWTYRECPAVRLAAALPPTGQIAMAEITVLETPVDSGMSSAPRSRFVASLDQLDLAGANPRPDCRVIVTWNGPPPIYGGRYRVRAVLSNCSPQRNPGAFDYTAWLANAGIRSQLLVTNPADTRLLAVEGNPVVRFAHISRAWIERTISLGIEGTPEAMLIRAMVVGDTTGASDAIKDAFRETGTFHLFSVSGLHVGIVAVMLWTTLGLFGASQRRSVLVVIPALFFYALLTGWSPASVRAAVMLSILAAGLLLDRPPTPLNSIGAAGLAILLADSSQLFNPGFQLSFGAVTAIILIAPPLHRRIEALFAPDAFLPARLIAWPHHLALRFAAGTSALMTVSLAAWLASLPLTVWYFHLVSLSAIPANLFAVPLSSAVLALAAIAMLAGGLSPWLAMVFNHANFLLAKVLLFLVQSFAALPGSALYVAPPAAPGTLATLTIFDAGAGGAAALIANGRAWVLDPGSEYFADMVTLPFLRMNGINRLDALVLTHGDGRHVGGAERLLAPSRPHVVLDTALPQRSPIRKRFLSALAEAGIPLTRANAGFTATIAPGQPPVRMSVLYPPAHLQAIRADDKAMVLRIEAGRFVALLVADAGISTEQWLLAHARDRLGCHLLVMGRHSSGHSGGLDFLRAAHPQALIATVADFPPEERLPAAWEADLRKAGIDLLRQDVTGAVTVTIQRDRFIAAPFLPAGGGPRTFSLSP